MTLRMTALGLATGLVAALANAWAQITFNWDITNFVLWFILPAGAMILGMVGAVGCGLATDLHASRQAEYGSLALSGLIVGFLTVLAFYFALYQYTIYPSLLHTPHLPFTQFLQELFSSFRLSAGPGDGGWDVGSGGAFMGWLDFAGGAFGGFASAVGVASWRRQQAGTRAIPSWIESCAAVMAEVAFADGRLTEEEIDSAIRVVRAHASEHFEDKENAQSSEFNDFTENLTMGTLRRARENPLPLDDHLGVLAGQAEVTRRIALLGVCYVAFADGNLHPDEEALLLVIAGRLGFSQDDLLIAARSAMSNLEGIYGKDHFAALATPQIAENANATSAKEVGATSPATR